MFFLVFGMEVMAQTGVLNPNDTIVVYNPAAPPTKPAANVLAKWVVTPRLNWNTSSLKSYVYNNLQFRIKWPKSYTAAADGKTYPMYVFFHGDGEGGTIYDNEYQMFHGGQIHSNAVDNGIFDGFLVYPQSTASSGGWSQAQINTVADLINNYFVPQLKVDVNRIVINGLSGGGSATWLFTSSFPMLAACEVPMSSASTLDQSYLNSLKYTPIWMLSGGLDNNPSPYTAQTLYSVFSNGGANMTYTLMPTLGHDTWDSTWLEPNYWPFLLAAHKANPWTVGGRNQFCPTDTINVTMGVTAGFTGYQWRKNGVVIPGATSNTLNVTSVGIYDCSILRGTTWSVWSPRPDTISIKAATVSPNIQVNGLASNVLPATDGSTTVSLMVPTGYTNYVWARVDSPATLSNTTNILTNTVPGTYAVKVTEQYGCSSSFSNPFTVIKANGPNPPSPASGLVAAALSQTQIRLNWTESAGQAYPETSFEIYQGAALAGPYKLVGYSPAFTDSFLVTNLNAKTTYYYKVRAINTTAAAAATSASSAQTISDIQAPTAPGNLRTGIISQTSVQLIWDSSSDNVAVINYDIYVNGNKVYSIPNQNSYTIYNLANGAYYNFIVRARDQAGNTSPSSNQLTAAAAFSGLNYKYYTFSGTWNAMADFGTLTPVATGNVPNITLSSATQTTNYAYLWQGFITIPVTGSYSFQTNSDDGSNLYLGALNQQTSPYSFSGTPLVKNDGLHGTQTITSTTLTLTAGVYPIAITYYQQGGGASMNMYWNTPQTGSSYVKIPDSAFQQKVAVPGAVPAPPSLLKATAVSAKKVQLTWQDNSTNETGFQVYRSVSQGGPFVVVGTLGAGKTSFSDSALTAATTYYYQVKAIGQYGSSGFNGQDSGMLTYNYYETAALSVLPNFATLTPVRTGLTDTVDLSMTNRGTNWASTYTGYINISTTGSYTFYTSSDDGSALYIDGALVVNNDGLHGTLEASGTVSGLTAGVHALQVRFFQNGGGQVLSASIAGPGLSKRYISSAMLGKPPVSVTTLALPVIPAAPSGLAGIALGPNKVTLTWIVNDTNAIKYEVWRSAATNTNYALDTLLTGRYSSLTDSSLAASSIYYYKVRAVNEGGSSAFSNEISDTTTANPLSTVTIDSIATQNVTNDTTGVVLLTARSTSGTSLTLTASGLPAFATLTSNSNGTGSISLKPTSTQLGAYVITVTATDNFGGTANRKFTLNVTGKNQTTIDLNFNQTLPATAPWNNMNSAANAGVVVSNLTDINGNTTTTGISLLSTWQGINTSGPNTGNNSGVFPDAVLKTFYYGNTTTSYQFQITGLSANKKYSLIFFAGYAWTAAQQSTYGTLITNYTVSGQTVSINAANNTTQVVQISGLSTDSTGKLTVAVSKPTGSAYCILNAMQILSYDASPSSLIPPSGLTGNGIAPDKITLNWTGSADIKTGFEVWRSTSPVGTYALIGTTGATTTTYTDSSLAANSTYFYQVREVVNNNQYSAFSSYAGGSTLAYVVNVSFNGAPTFREMSPAWNDFNTVAYAGFVMPNMTNSTGQNTGINLNILKNFSGFDANVGITTGNNSGVVPDTVMETLYFQTHGDTAKFSISGLSLTGIYNFSFFGGTTYNLSTNTVYQVGSQSGNLNALGNTTQTVVLRNIKPDSTGTVYVTFYSTLNYAFINSLTIQAMTSPDAVAYDSLGGGGIASYLAMAQNVVPGAARAELTNDSTAADSTVDNIHFAAYPNPFVDAVTITANFKQNIAKFAVVIVDAQGHIVQKNEYTNGYTGSWKQTITLRESLPNGLYFIQLTGISGEKPRTFTLVKYKR